MQIVTQKTPANQKNKPLAPLLLTFASALPVFALTIVKIQRIKCSLAHKYYGRNAAGKIFWTAPPHFFTLIYSRLALATEISTLDPTRGIVVACSGESDAHIAQSLFFAELVRLGIDTYLQCHKGLRQDALCLHMQLSQGCIDAWMPGFHTLDLCKRLGLRSSSDRDDLSREVWLTMLASPLILTFPSAEELISAVRIRVFTVEAARKTAMDFHTTQAERPKDSWTYHPDTGFTILPGKSLITALQEATQPDLSGQLYSFSCYRATEYVLLLAIAMEAEISNPALLQKLQAQWETCAVMSGRFHDVFLREYGSMHNPLPIGYYIPGDRIWFRNPDDASSDVAGYEGSWEFYLGNDQFPNFWQRDKPFNLRSKCIEIYHWRHATYRDARNELQVDETVLNAKIEETRSKPQQAEDIFQRMFRLRDPQGIYDQGGCMDTTREAVRQVRPETSDIVMPGRY